MAALRAKFEKVAQDYDRRLKEEHLRYDRVTSNGTKLHQQAVERKRQLDSLRKLRRALDERKKGKRSR